MTPEQLSAIRERVATSTATSAVVNVSLMRAVLNHIDELTQEAADAASLRAQLARVTGQRDKAMQLLDEISRLDIVDPTLLTAWFERRKELRADVAGAQG